MGHRLRVGVYSPFFGSTYGGGEKYLGVTAETIRDAFPDVDVELLSPVRVDVERYERLLGLDLGGIAFTATNPSGSRLKGRLARAPLLRQVRNLAVSAQAMRYTRRYDLFINMVYGLPAFSAARGGVILCQFPYDLHLRLGRPGPAKLVRRLAVRPYRLLRRRLLGGELDAFQLVICQSQYVRGWVRRLWDRDSLVVHPPIDIPTEEPDWAAKQPRILSVGRFFARGHNKRHDMLVTVFRELCDAGLEGWELHLAGSVQRANRADVAYLEQVTELARGYPVYVHADAPRELLEELYRTAAVYWHAAGYGADADGRPADLEHFGMTTAEAMARGVVPVVIASGGQPELIDDGVTGCLWGEPPELQARTLALATDPDLRRRMGEAARRASRRFSRPRFELELTKALRPVIETLRTPTAPPAALSLPAERG